MRNTDENEWSASIYESARTIILQAHSIEEEVVKISNPKVQQRFKDIIWEIQTDILYLVDFLIDIDDCEGDAYEIERRLNPPSTDIVSQS